MLNNSLESFETSMPSPTGGSMSPPYSEAERYLLACIFVDGAESLSVCYEAGIGASSFSDPKCRIVFDACQTLHAAGRQIAIWTVAEELRSRKKFDELGGSDFLTKLTSELATTAQLRGFAEIVRKQAQVREVIRLTASVQDECRRFSCGAGDGELRDYLSSTFARLSSALSGASADQAEKWQDTVSKVEKRAVAMIENKAEPPGETIPFPWPILNRVFKPMRRKELVVIAARPSVGKSSLMRPIVLHAAMSGLNVCVESLEVSPEEMAIQMAATASKVQWGKLAAANSYDQKDFLSALRDLALPNFHAFDCDRSLAAIIARAKAIHVTKPLDVLAIDYLGLIADCVPKRGETKAQAIGKVTNELKQLARELNCVIVLLSQLNRSSATDGREPQMNDLRDSGDIEQDADRVILIHRPSSTPDGIKQSDTDLVEDLPSFFQQLIQAKGRNVGTGLAEFMFRRETTNFVPVAQVSSS